MRDKFNGWKAGMEKRGFKNNMDKTIEGHKGKVIHEPFTKFHRKCSLSDVQFTI
jgi:hypothetical protein